MKYVQIIRQELKSVEPTENKKGFTEHWKYAGSCIQPINRIHNAISEKLDHETCKNIRYIIKIKNISDEEYKKIPEFLGWGM